MELAHDVPPSPTSVNDGGHIYYFRAGGVGLIFDAQADLLPRILHWGADLGPLSDELLRDLALATVPPFVSNSPDRGIVLGLLPEQARSWPGTPGLTGHRDGRDWSPFFRQTTLEVNGTSEGTQRCVIQARDADAELSLRIELELTDSGLVRLRGAVRNDGGTIYTLDGLLLALPVPSRADEILDFTGRHLRERSPQRQPFQPGTRARDSRRGRTGHDATLLLIAGSAGFNAGSGEVWGLHVAWSGNHRTLAELLPSGERLLAGGELLLPGEIRLRPGDEYVGPWLYGSYGVGLDDLSGRIHRYVRNRPLHPRRPRPVTLNTWEAVYFDQSPSKLSALAEAAAELGVERFVLDDGWFAGRKDDRSSLGDWYVDENVWPDGLAAFSKHVRGLGMEFGLWVEPEMISSDSDLARAHPEWIMGPRATRPAPEWRNQQVLDLTHPDAYVYILERLDSLVSELSASFLKWDHNRDLIESGHQPAGEAAVHQQTLAVYSLLAKLRARHPSLEIESCASGGGRIDLGILEHTQRVWASDSNDALERQTINRWTKLLLPPELVGAHVGPRQSHTTGRIHDINFRAGTAIFGHFGIETDILEATSEERLLLQKWIALYKERRALLHSGRVVHGDHLDPAYQVYGVVAHDQSEALFCFAALATSICAPPGPVRLPGLDPRALYAVRLLPPGDVIRAGKGTTHGHAPWVKQGGVTLTGDALAHVGVQAPDLFPEQLLLLHVERYPGKAGRDNMVDTAPTATTPAPKTS